MAGRRATLRGPHVAPELAAGRSDQAFERLIWERGHLRERADPLQEQDLALVDVADAGHDRLIQQRIRDVQVGGSAQAGERFGRVEIRREQVRPEAPQALVAGHLLGR